MTTKNHNTNETKTGIELQVGDVVKWSECKTITGFESHPGLTKNGEHHPARVAKSGEYGITVFDDCHFRRTSDGVLIQTHLWFHHEQELKRKRERYAGR